MLNSFLRTAPTRRLLATLAGVVVAVGGGAAIAVAATSGGPVPKPRPLAVAIHDAFTAKPVQGISADVRFTNNLIPSFEIQGSDPLLTGGSGHIWVTNDGRLRLELYGDNGDPEVVLTPGSWWIYDPTLHSVYRGKFAAGQTGANTEKSQRLPPVSQIQSELGQLASHLMISGAIPTDVGGQPAFTVKLSPKSSGGLIGQLQLAWDANAGVPLRFAIYARGEGNPALELAASNVSYTRIAVSVFNLSPPRGAHAVTIATPNAGGSADRTDATGKPSKQHSEISGAVAVSKHLAFKLAAPPQLDGLARQAVSLLDMGSHKGALLTYGQGLGAVVVIETASHARRQLKLSSGSGDHANGIALPTVHIHGATGQQLDTALGTILTFSSRGVTYTVLGSVRPAVLDAAARGL